MKRRGRRRRWGGPKWFRRFSCRRSMEHRGAAGARGVSAEKRRAGAKRRVRVCVWYGGGVREGSGKKQVRRRLKKAALTLEDSRTIHPLGKSVFPQRTRVCCLLRPANGVTAGFLSSCEMRSMQALLTVAYASAQSCQPLDINSNAAIHETELFFPSWSTFSAASLTAPPFSSTRLLPARTATSLTAAPQRAPPPQTLTAAATASFSI